MLLRNLASTCRKTWHLSRSFAETTLESYDNYVVMQVGSVALPISREALAEAQKHSIPIQALLGKGSGERGRVNYFDVHRMVHPPTFRCKALAEAEKTHLKGNVLDKIFEKSYGSGAAAPPKPASTTADKKITQPAAKEGKDAAKTAPVAPAEPKGVTAGFLLPTKKRPFRKPGQAPKSKETPITPHRKQQIEQLSTSIKQIPHYHLTTKINAEKLLRFRDEVNQGRKAGEHITIDAIVIKAVAAASKLVPEVRSEWDPKNDRIRVFASTDVAYLTSCCESTVAPVIFGVENMKLSQIADTLGEFGQLAKNHKLETDVGHGTIGVISLADSGVRQFSSIVRAPQTCVVCIGAPFKELVTKSTGETKPQQSATATSSQSKDETKPKVEKTEQKKPETQPAKPVADVSIKPAADNKEPQYSAATFINITLSCDHRIVDGAVGSQFLTHLKAFVENPIKLLI